MSWHITNNKNLQSLATRNDFDAAERASRRPISSASVLALQLSEWYEKPSSSYRCTDENAIDELHARRSGVPSSRMRRTLYGVAQSWREAK